jgi:flavin reductase ActVB
VTGVRTRPAPPLRPAGVTLRDAMAQVATPVSVVTAADESGRPWGVTVGTLCSLSLAPPLVMFSLGRSRQSYDVLTTTARLLIHVLRDDQPAVAARFSQPGIDRFAGLNGDWHGLPTIPETALRLACTRYAVVPAGDHAIVMCLVNEAEIGDGSPLLYHQREYCSTVHVSDSSQPTPWSSEM